MGSWGAGLIITVATILIGAALVWNWWDDRRFLREGEEANARFKKALENLDDARVAWQVRGSLIAVNVLDEVISGWETADKERVLALIRGMRGPLEKCLEDRGYREMIHTMGGWTTEPGKTDETNQPKE